MSLGKIDPFDPYGFDEDEEYDAALEWCQESQACEVGLIEALENCTESLASQGSLVPCNSQILVGVDPVELVLQAAAMHGTVNVAAAGNCGNVLTLGQNECWLNGQLQQHRETYPARYSSVISVANIDRSGRSPGSSANDSVDIAAPGHCILSTVIQGTGDGDRDCSTRAANGNYDYRSGTSMAAPIVSGVMAHLRARFPDTSVARLTEAIYVTASQGDVGTDTNCNREDSDQFTNAPANHGEAHGLCYGHGIIEPLDSVAFLENKNASIAFLTDDDGSQQVAVMNLDGSGRRVLTTNENSKWSPSLSPDASRIVFAEQTGAQKQDLWIINRDGTGLTRLTDDSGVKFAPAWKPDSSRISYVRNYSHRCGFFWLRRCAGREVWTVASNGTDPKKIYSTDGDVFSPSWTYDGEHLVLSLDGDIVELDVNNGATRTILSGGDSKAHFCPSPSPDGKHIAFATWRDGQDDVVVTDMQGSSLLFLATSDADDYCPVWAPDGETLVFVSDRDGDSELYSVSVDGSNLQQLTSNGAADFQPSIAKSTVSIPGELNPLLESVRQFILSLSGSEARATALSSTWDHVCGPVDGGAVNCWGESASSEVVAPSEAHLGASAGAAHSCAMGCGRIGSLLGHRLSRPDRRSRGAVCRCCGWAGTILAA